MAFWNEVAVQKSRLSLLDSPQVASPHKGEIPALMIDRIEGRFLLCGASDATVSIFDLSKWGTDRHLRGGSGEHDTHRPVARSVRVPYGDPMEVPHGHSHSIVAVQWYPIDTGAFLSACANGSVLVWDTSVMKPVVRWTPFPSIRCMHMSTSTGRSESLLGVGSADESFVRLVDVRSGASSHSFVGHQGGVSCVQWSPVCDVILASGGLDGTIRLWDIRKSGSRSCVTVLDRDQSFDSTTQGRGYDSSYSHLSRKPKCSPNYYLHDESNATLSHRGAVSALSFCADGTSLVSTGMDGKLQVWDLRGNGHVLPLNFSSSQKTNQSAVSRSRAQVPLVLQECGNKGTVAWVGHGAKVLGYSLQKGGRPVQVLEGHMHTVTALERVDHSMRLLSAAMDGMILEWGHVPRANARKRNRAGGDHSREPKRIRETEGGDRDSW